MSVTADQIKKALSIPSDWNAEYKDVFGKYNDAPPNWEEVSADYFWSRFSQGGVGVRQTHRQIRRGPKESLLSVHLFHFADGTGLGVHVDWDYKAKQAGGVEWPPTFFSFAACVHDRVATLDTQRGWHEGHCSKCEMQMNYDSGD